MDSNFNAIASVLLVLAFVLVVYVGILVTIGWVVMRLWRWLRRQPRVVEVLKEEARLVRSLRTRWALIRDDVTSSLELVFKVIIEPFFFGYAVFTLFNKIESFTAYTKAYPQSDFWQRLTVDMENDVNLYSGFIVIFTIWIMVKGWQYGQERKHQRNLDRRLTNIETALTNLPANIAKALEEGHGKPK